MTGTCKLCRVLIVSPPVAEVGPARQKAEFLAFATEAQRHVYQHHESDLQVYAGLLGMAAAALSTLFMDCPLDDFKTAQSSVLAFVADRIKEAELVVDVGSAVTNPLVTA